MGKSFFYWGCWFVFLFLIDFFVPFFLLTDVPKLRGSFFFWIAWIVVAIVSMFIMFLKWQEADRPNPRG